MSNKYVRTIIEINQKMFGINFLENFVYFLNKQHSKTRLWFNTGIYPFLLLEVPRGGLDRICFDSF